MKWSRNGRTQRWLGASTDLSLRYTASRNCERWVGGREEKGKGKKKKDDLRLTSRGKKYIIKVKPKTVEM